MYHYQIWIKNVNSSDLVVTEQSFDQTEFLNHHCHLQKLKKHLSEYANTWNQASADYYSPCIAIINSSMIGKSRLVVELATADVFVFVTCFRTQTNGNYRPPRTSSIANWATTRLFQLQCCKFFEEC
jgi:hypothetical protein